MTHCADTVGLGLKSSTANEDSHVDSLFEDTASKQGSASCSHQTGLMDSGTAHPNRYLLQSEEKKEKLALIQAAMTGNMRRSKWLKGFEPLSMSCPLLGRRIRMDAVSEWANAAWDCDGLGFSWKCLQPAH